jgi:hypothetical protein
MIIFTILNKSVGPLVDLSGLPPLELVLEEMNYSPFLGFLTFALSSCKLAIAF